MSELRESCLKVSSALAVFKNMEEKSTPKKYHPVSLLSSFLSNGQLQMVQDGKSCRNM